MDLKHDLDDGWALDDRPATQPAGTGEPGTERSDPVDSGWALDPAAGTMVVRSEERVTIYPLTSIRRGRRPQPPPSSAWLEQWAWACA